MRIALAGNPNSGKTTLFNALTGGQEKVGNWAGVTVEKKVRPIRRRYAQGHPLVAVDLPGAYSLSPFTAEERITRDAIAEDAPDVLINIVDATNLSRSLFLTTQLLELGIPVVVALNKQDINRKKGTVIDADALSRRLGCPVIHIAAARKTGLKELVEAAVSAVGSVQTAPCAGVSDEARLAFANEAVAEVEKRQVLTRDRNLGDRLDDILTDGRFGIPIFALVMFLVFQISQVWVGQPLADLLVGWLEAGQSWEGEWVSEADPLLHALLVEGILGGVIAVVGFLPLVMVMYFLIALLEDWGYMARAAVVLDPIFKKVGLSGRSVIPFVITVGCAVPGIMASRTIRDLRERRAAVMLAPFMPCGAKIPVIALFAGMFFDNAGWVSTLMYLMGILFIFLGALLVGKITGTLKKKNFFLMELPEYKRPSVWAAFKSMCARGWSYIVKAATVILLCNTAVQLMQSFDWSFSVAATADSSILASLARPFAWLLVPIVGVLSWELAAAAVTGFIAKENVVGTLAVCFVGLENLIDAETLELLAGTGTEAAGIMAISKAAALAYLMFNLYTPPCFAAIGAMRAEMGSRKWFWGGIGLQLAVGYTAAYLVYTVGTLLTAPGLLNIPAALAGGAAVAVFAGVVIRLTEKGK